MRQDIADVGPMASGRESIVQQECLAFGKDEQMGHGLHSLLSKFFRKAGLAGGGFLSLNCRLGCQGHDEPLCSCRLMAVVGNGGHGLWRFPFNLMPSACFVRLQVG